MIKKLLSVLLIAWVHFSVMAQSCDSATTKNRANLGIYSGISNDLSFSNTSGRLYAIPPSAYSLFYSDDTAKTWIPALPYDSLEYECGERGWGGGGIKVLTNNNGGVLFYSKESTGELASIVFNNNNGEIKNWKTVTDNYTLKNFPSANSFQDICLTDNNIYVFTDDFVVVYDTALKVVDSIFVKDLDPFLSGDAHFRSGAAANTLSGYPMYIIVDTASSQSMSLFSNGQFFYRYDGSNAAPIMLPSQSESIINVYTTNFDNNGDTIFVSVFNLLGEIKLYRSYNQGVNWDDISYVDINFFPITDLDYSKDWKNTFVNSNGYGLMLKGGAYSMHLGNLWSPLNDLEPNVGIAIHPSNPDVMIGCNTSEILVSNSGGVGPFSSRGNEGYAAVQVQDLSFTDSKKTFYIATMSGLAYTTAYLDTGLKNYDKWKGQYGDFPLVSGGNILNQQFRSVAIDPNDSLHVVGGFSEQGSIGFIVSQTGPAGFGKVSFAFDADENYIMDIEFVTSDIVLAVTLSDDRIVQTDVGKIWRSSDGGLSWVNVSPANFSAGQCIAVSFTSYDTVIYVGSGSNNGNDGKLWRSEDKGVTWTYINTGPKDIGDSSYTNLPILDMAIYPGTIDTIYMACGNNKLNRAFVVTYDGGLTYKYIDVLGEGEFSSVTINTENPDSIIYFSSRRDIYLYIPVMDTVILIFKGPPGENVPELSIGSLLAGTSTGFYSIELETIDDIVVPFYYSEGYDFNYKLYPNPFTDQGSATLELILTEDAYVQWILMDMNGKEYQKSNLTRYNLGKHNLAVDIKSYSSGIYTLKLLVNDEVSYTRIVKIN